MLQDCFDHAEGDIASEKNIDLYADSVKELIRKCKGDVVEMHAQTSWLVCLRTYSISPYPSLLSPHPTIVPVPKKAKVTELNDYL
jgi:hypothetical protein